MTPRIIRAYVQADEIRRQRVDTEAWLHNMYTYNAVQVALDHGFNGKKAKSHYPERPFLESEAISSQDQKGNKTIIDEEHPENTVLSREDQRKVNYLFARLGVMKANWEIENKLKNKADSV